MQTLLLFSTYSTTLENFIYWFGTALGAIFTIMYFHQFVYLIIGFFKTSKVDNNKEYTKHKLGIVISARNEEKVIGNLLDSIRKNDYPSELYDIIVIADNCTDNTAELCRRLGCIVFERQDAQHIGKGYALHYMFDKLHTEKEYEKYNFDAYVVLDADNLLAKNYLTEINKVYDNGYKMVTSYRNTKNFGQNWITDGYGIWFLREARYLNNPRMLLKTSCAISGTGFLVDKSVIKEYNNWDFFFLTEDIQFSAEYTLRDRKIGYAHNAVLYDEQPATFKQAWTQRERWSKGFYQVFGSRAGKLTRHMVKNFGCWDILTSIFPALIISLLTLIVYPICMIIGAACANQSAVMMSLNGMLSSIGTLLGCTFVFGLLVLITEGKNIKIPLWKKVWHLITFPVFMATYLPIGVCALFKKVEWKPIYHNAAISIEELNAKNVKNKKRRKCADPCEVINEKLDNEEPLSPSKTLILAATNKNAKINTRERKL